MDERNLTIIEETTPEEEIVDERISEEELDVGEITVIGKGVKFNSLDFVTEDGELIYENETAKFNGQFKYTIVEKPDEIMTSNGSINLNIKGTDGVIVDADENNNAVDIHLDPIVTAEFGKVNDVIVNGESIIVNKIGNMTISLDQDPNSSLIYYLKVNDNNVGTINIPKDQFLKSVVLDESTYVLTFTWETTTGIQTTTIDLRGLIDLYTAGNGLKLENNIFSINLDPSTNVLLSVSENGLKLDLTPIQTQINELQQETTNIINQLPTITYL